MAHFRKNVDGLFEELNWFVPNHLALVSTVMVASVKVSV